MGDPNEKLLSTQEGPPMFDDLQEGCFDDWNSIDSATKTKWALQDPFAVPVLDVRALHVSSGSYGLSLAGSLPSRRGPARRRSSFGSLADFTRDSKSTMGDAFASFDTMPFELPGSRRAKTAAAQPSERKHNVIPEESSKDDSGVHVRGGRGPLRRRSSFGSLADFSRGGISTMGDPFDSFDSMPFEIPGFRRATATTTIPKTYPQVSSIQPNAEAERQSQSESLPSARGKTVCSSQSTTRGSGSRSLTSTVARSKSHDDQVLPSRKDGTSNQNNAPRRRSPRRTHSSGATVHYETDGGGDQRARSNDNSSKSGGGLVKDDVNEGRRREHDATSLSGNLSRKIKDETSGGRSRETTPNGNKLNESKSQQRTIDDTSESGPRCFPISPHRTKSRDTTTNYRSNNDRLDKSSGSILSQRVNISRSKKSAESSHTDHTHSNSSSQLDYLAHMPGLKGALKESGNRSAGKAITVLSRDDFDISESTKSKKGTKIDRHASSGNLRQDESGRRPRSPMRSKDKGRSPSRSDSKQSSGSEQHQSRSNSRSRKINSAAVAEKTSLLRDKNFSHNDDEEEHFLSLDRCSAPDKSRTSGDARKKLQSKLPSSQQHRATGGTNESVSSGSTGCSGSRLRRAKSVECDTRYPHHHRSTKISGIGLGQDRTYRSENKSPTRGRCANSVEANDLTRSVPTEGKKRRSPSATPRGRRPGSVEAPRDRRNDSVDPGTASIVKNRGRRTHSVEARAPRSRPRRTGSVDAPRSRSTKDAGLACGSPATTDLLLDDEEEVPSPPVFLPSISGMPGGEVPTWKMQRTNAKAQPCDRDDGGKKETKDAKKARRLTQAEWAVKIKSAKQSKK